MTSISGQDGTSLASSLRENAYGADQGFLTHLTPVNKTIARGRLSIINKHQYFLA